MEAGAAKVGVERGRECKKKQNQKQFLMFFYRHQEVRHTYVTSAGKQSGSKIVLK